MKWFLVTVGVVILSFTLTAAQLEMSFSGGFTRASLFELNEQIVLINGIIEFITDGQVPPLGQLGDGITWQLGESFRLTKHLSVGGKLEYFSTSTATRDSYISGAAAHEVSIDLSCDDVGFLAMGSYDLIDAGIVLSLELGAGYYYSHFSRAITFELPAGYLEGETGISELPQTGKVILSGGGLGGEAGLSLSLSPVEWLQIGTSISYRFLPSVQMNDPLGEGLTIIEDEQIERIGLSGVTIQLSGTLFLNLFD
jgi:hypothetical protein